jgi:hypothetical protein
VELTTNELIAELHRAFAAMDGPNDGYTTTDIRDLTGWGLAKTLTVLRQLIRDGAVKPVRVRRPRIDGQMNTVTAYILTPKKVAR